MGQTFRATSQHWMSVPSAATNEELLQRSVADPEAYGVFYDRQFDQIFGWFLLRTFAAEVAADLTAETFAAALGSVHRFSPHKGEAGAWLQAIANNQLRHWLRRQRVAGRSRAQLGMHMHSSFDDDDFDLVDARLALVNHIGPLHQAVDRLSPQLREAVLLRVVEELSYAEIAERLDTTVGAARVRVSRALAELTEALS